MATLFKREAGGPPHTTTRVTITKNPAYGTRFWSVRLNQYGVDTADGKRSVYDNGPTIVKGVLILRNVSKTEGDSLRTWLIGTSTVQAKFGAQTFDITPPSATDLGKGAGTAITVYYDGEEDIDGVLDFHAPGQYDITFPYRESI